MRETFEACLRFYIQLLHLYGAKNFNNYNNLLLSFPILIYYMFGIMNYISWKDENTSGCGNLQEVFILIKGNVNISCKFMETLCIPASRVCCACSVYMRYTKLSVTKLSVLISPLYVHMFIHTYV